MAKIILVEDEINIASFIERGLREFGHEVSVVYDGNAGWELLQNESFDLLILDIIMPGMNGLELCRMYRQRFGYHSPVVMLTALGTTDDIVKGLDAGADDLRQIRAGVERQRHHAGDEPADVHEAEQADAGQGDGVEQAVVDDGQLHQHRGGAEHGDIRPGQPPDGLDLAQTHQRQQQGGDHGQQHGHHRQQQRVFKAADKGGAVLGQEREVEEVGVVHVDKQIIPRHRRDILSKVLIQSASVQSRGFARLR